MSKYCRNTRGTLKAARAPFDSQQHAERDVCFDAVRGPDRGQPDALSRRRCKGLVRRGALSLSLHSFKLQRSAARPRRQTALRAFVSRRRGGRATPSIVMSPCHDVYALRQRGLEFVRYVTE